MKHLVIEMSTSNLKFLLTEYESCKRTVLNYPYPRELLEGPQDISLLLQFLHTHLEEIFETHEFEYISSVTTWHGFTYSSDDLRTCSPLYLWNDTGALEAAEKYKKDPVFSEMFFGATGCQIHPCFPFFKSIRYLQGVERKGLKTADLGVILNLLLTGRYVIGVSMASATGFFDNSLLSYSLKLLEEAGLSEENFPEVLSESELLDISDEFRERYGIRNDPKVQLCIPDGAANQIGALPEDNDLTLSVGTSSAMRMNVSEGFSISRDKGLFLYRTPSSKLLGAATNSGTNLIEWYIKNYVQDFTGYEKLESELKTDLMFLPFVFGERSPSWSGERPYGFSREFSDTREGYKALQEGILFNIRQCYEIFEEVYGTGRILVSGGIVNSQHFLQMCSDVLGRKLYVCDFKDASLFGAYYLSLLNLGIEISDRNVYSEIIVPRAEESSYYNEKYYRYLLMYNG